MMDFASMCEIGQKENNNDFIGISEDLHCACFAVADGKNNAAASEIIINSVLNDFKSSAEITTTSIPNFFENAQKELRKEVTCRDPNLDCSMAVLMTNGEMAVWGHIGDCRIYLLREDLLYEITPDHSAAYAAYEAGDIRYPKIRRRRERHTLFRHFGAEDAFRPEISLPTLIKPGDSFLLCSDGFWEQIHERQIEKTQRKSKSASDWLARMQTIIQKNGSKHKYTRIKDDMSAITIKL